MNQVAREDWRRVRLGEIFDIGSSKRVMQADWRQEGVPFYRAREIVRLARDGFVDNELFISESHFEALSDLGGVPQAGDLMVSAVGTLGACYVVKDVDRFYYKDASVLHFRPRSDVEPEFIRYAFLSDELLAQVQAGEGATVGTFTIERARRASISLPPLNEQKRIVAKLDQAFTALDRARANAEANLADVRGLRAKAIEDVLSDAKLGDFEPCGRHVDLLSGFAFKSAGYSAKESDVRLVRGDNIVQGDFRWSGVMRWPESDRAAYQKYELAKGDVLIAMDRTWVSAGIKYAVVDEGALPSLLVQRVARLRAMPSVLPEYLAKWIGSPLFERYVLSIQTGLGVPHVSGGQLENFQMRVPSLDEQSKVVSKLGRIIDGGKRLSESYERKCADIADLRQSLLRAAFSGQLS